MQTQAQTALIAARNSSAAGLEGLCKEKKNPQALASGGRESRRMPGGHKTCWQLTREMPLQMLSLVDNGDSRVASV